MTHNSNFKRRARDLAKERGIPYAEARTRLQHVAEGLIDKAEHVVDAASPAAVRIQQRERDDGVLPYPFFIEPGGRIARQDVWRGDPSHLVGFTADPDEYAIVLTVPEFEEDPDRAIGMHPVMADSSEDWATYPGPVVSVTGPSGERVAR